MIVNRHQANHLNLNARHTVIPTRRESQLFAGWGVRVN